jgi:hypothetical protein
VSAARLFANRGTTLTFFPALETIERIAAALKVPVADLIAAR